MQNAVKGALGLEEFRLTYSKVESPDGSPIRDYIDVNDLIDAHYKAYKYLNGGGDSDEINLSTGVGKSVEEIVNLVEKELGVELPRTLGETRAGEYAAIYADYVKAKDILGWEPTRTIKDSILSLRDWYKSTPRGFER